MLQIVLCAGIARYCAIVYGRNSYLIAGPSASPAAADSSAERPTPVPAPSPAVCAGTADHGQRVVDPRQRAADPRLAATQAHQAQVCGITPNLLLSVKYTLWQRLMAAFLGYLAEYSQ